VILVVIGVVLWIVGALGHGVGGRKHHWLPTRAPGARSPKRRPEIGTAGRWGARSCDWPGATDQVLLCHKAPTGRTSGECLTASGRSDHSVGRGAQNTARSGFCPCLEGTRPVSAEVLR
jgi:hypothetical protein